ncbi:MAG: hypothetical protein AAFP84_11390 [Actinomycetota bacterium]
MRPADRAIPAEVLARPVSGHHVQSGASLGSLLEMTSDGVEPVLLVFLRHYG